MIARPRLEEIIASGPPSQDAPHGSARFGAEVVARRALESVREFKTRVRGLASAARVTSIVYKGLPG